jgi:hypothetical protein
MAPIAPAYQRIRLFLISIDENLMNILTGVETADELSEK